MRRRRLASSFVVTVALFPACGRSASKPPESQDATKPEPAERSWTEFRNGVCEVMPECTPPPGAQFNPCNPPPPRQMVDCPAEILPTQPPATKVTREADGTCWVACDAATCDAPGPLRVRCPVDGAAAPTYETAVVVPARTTARYDTGVFHRRADQKCDLVECEDGTKCEHPPGRTFTNVPCPKELVSKVAPGVVPVQNLQGCFYGTVAVECPARFHTWH